MFVAGHPQKLDANKEGSIFFDVGPDCGFKQLHSVGLIKDKW